MTPAEMRAFVADETRMGRITRYQCDVIERWARELEAATTILVLDTPVSDELQWTFTEYQGRSKGVVVLDAAQAQAIKRYLISGSKGDIVSDVPDEATQNRSPERGGVSGQDVPVDDQISAGPARVAGPGVPTESS